MPEKDKKPKSKPIEKPGEVTAKKSKTKLKIIIMLVVDGLLVVAIILLLNNYNEVASKIKSLRSENILAQESVDAAVLQSDLDKNQSSIAKLQDVFVNEDGLINFINQVDNLKTNGVITDFIFPSNKPSVDKDKDLGFPVIFEITGDRATVENSLQQVQSLPFIIKPVNVELTIGEEAVITVKYGATLVVNENFNKN